MAVMDEKSSPLFPIAGEAVISNDWCIMHPKDADGIANSVDCDQTAPPLGVV